MFSTGGNLIENNNKIHIFKKKIINKNKKTNKNRKKTHRKTASCNFKIFFIKCVLVIQCYLQCISTHGYLINVHQCL